MSTTRSSVRIDLMPFERLANPCVAVEVVEQLHVGAYHVRLTCEDMKTAFTLQTCRTVEDYNNLRCMINAKRRELWRAYRAREAVVARLTKP